MVFGKLLPREGKFFELFNDHGTHMAAGATAFLAMARSYADEPERSRQAEAVGAAERAADRVTAEVQRQLHRTFITPIDREQIHELINALDDVRDLLRDTSEVMSLCDLQHLSDDCLRLSEISVRCCDRVGRSAMSRLFREEPDTRELIKLKTVYQHLESIGDRCEDVANLVEGIVLENS
jgi:uncharacterized protein Yka (UPF0111/DUF47 family)